MTVKFYISFGLQVIQASGLPRIRTTDIFNLQQIVHTSNYWPSCQKSGNNKEKKTSAILSFSLHHNGGHVVTVCSLQRLRRGKLTSCSHMCALLATSSIKFSQIFWVPLIEWSEKSINHLRWIYEELDAKNRYSRVDSMIGERIFSSNESWESEKEQQKPEAYAYDDIQELHASQTLT